ncbi:MAG: DUF2723 domain-containing protein [Chitinophagales bacterium]
MDLYKKLNTIVGWLVFLVALITYTLTLEPTTSFWDCGEFIAGAYKLQVVHPPGAPFFLLLGRIFTLFAPDPSWVAYTINFMSGLSTAFAILFLFWVTTHFAQKLVFKGEEPNKNQVFSVIAAGLVAGLSCTFLDTVWFSAVEGEVYALSLFFIMLVFWLMVKWDQAKDEKTRDRWLVFIALMLGISVGVHLLSLLAMPAMGILYYYRRFKSRTWQGILLAFTGGFLVQMFIYVGVVLSLTTILAKADLFFVNTLGFGFGSGAIFVLLAIVALFVAALMYTTRKKMVLVNTALLSLMVLMIGYSTYAIVMIRAHADTPINMNEPSNLFRLNSYLNREQYGDRPLLYGPHHNAYPTDIEKKGNKYHQGEEKYIVIGERVDYKFAEKDKMFFPRLGSWQDERHARAYNAMLGLEKGEDPSFRDNISFFVNYQLGFMYLRYFMWNFTGRQDDIQGRYDNNNGKWISGIPFIDQYRIGPLDNLTDYQKENKGRNLYYFLPLLLGLLGLYYQYKRDPWDAAILMGLFLFTGILQAVFLNSPPFEPRERDYTLVGSFVAFSIWIGFGVLALYEFLKEKIPAKTALAGSLAICLIIPVLLAAENWDDHDRSRRTTALDFAIDYLESCKPNAILFTQGDNDTYPLWYAQEVEGIRTDIRVVNLSLLGVDWYIDHLHKKMNDAEAVKLIHTTEKYLGSNRDVTRYYDAKKLPADRYYELKDIVGFIASDDSRTKVTIQSGEQVNYLPAKKLKISVDSVEAVKQKMVPPEFYNKIETELTWNLNKNNVLKNDLITLDIIASNFMERPIYFAVSVSPSAYLGLQKFFQLEGLAYQIVPVSEKSSDGQSGYVATEIMYDNVMDKFKLGGIERKIQKSYTVEGGEDIDAVAYKFGKTVPELKADIVAESVSPGQTINFTYPDQDIYLNENILRMTMNLRSNYARLAAALLDKGDKERALAVLDRCMEVMPEANVPYNIFMIKFPELYYQAGDAEKARLLIKQLSEVYEQELKHASDVVGTYDPKAKRNMQQAIAVFQELIRITRSNGDKDLEAELNEKFSSLQEYFAKAQ